MTISLWMALSTCALPVRLGKGGNDRAQIGQSKRSKNVTNGSRSHSSRHSDRTSLDALNRTIEGLEARIEGLMGSGREQRPRNPTPERDPYASPYAPRAADPLAEIRQRQRALDATRENRERAYTREAGTRPFCVNRPLAPAQQRLGACSRRQPPSAPPTIR